MSQLEQLFELLKQLSPYYPFISLEIFSDRSGHFCLRNSLIYNNIDFNDFEKGIQSAQTELTDLQKND